MPARPAALPVTRDGARERSVGVEQQVGRPPDPGDDLVAQEGRRGQQDAIDEVALGAALAPVMSGLDPPDRAPVGLLGRSALVEERRELGLELGLQTLLVAGGGLQHDVGSLERAGRALGRPVERRPRRLAEREPVRRGRHAGERGPRLPPDRRAASRARTSGTPSPVSCSTTNDSESAVNVTT